MRAMEPISMKSRQGWSAAIGWLSLYGAGFLAALSLKLYYSRAGADELSWILAPTSLLAELLTGDHFQREPRAGWISHSGRIILGPSCAGVNFLVITFSAFFFSFVRRLKSPAGRGLWLLTSLGGAYILTLATNTLRIIAAIRLHEMDIYGGLLTPQRVHRAEGTIVYCVSLVLGYLVVERALGSLGTPSFRPHRPSPLIPLGWYVAIALGLPLLNRVYRGGEGPFVEHAALVLLVCLALALVLCAPRIASHGCVSVDEGDPWSDSPRSRC